jgi:type IV pilus assembly protein PilB
MQHVVQWAGLTQSQINAIEPIQRKKRLDFLHAALEAEELSSDQFVAFLAERLGLPAVDPSRFKLPDGVLDLVPKALLSKYQVVPFHIQGKKLFLAVAEPEDILALDDIRFMTGMDLVVHVAAPDAIKRCLDSLHEHEAGEDFEELEEALMDMEDEKVEFDSEEEEAGGDEVSTLEAASLAPVVKMVNLIIMDSIRKKASDIHIEPYEKSFRVRLRIDGMLHEVMRPPLRLKNAMISRLKIMAHLNIAERRLPQDGRIKVRTPGGKEVEFRVSILPTLFGEKVVMRLLDKSALKVDMTRLGFEEDSLQRVQAAIAKPYGMVLVTGPTGSGKTTTLYSALMELNREGVNISTVEDPVEFSLSGINQVQVLDDIGLSFAAALRSFLRQDPDIILVGEIRDRETAEIAVKAALTGHLVLSTLHTNDAPSSLNRLLNMGVDGFLVASSINVIVAQRLIRKLCPFCKEPMEANDQALEAVGLSPAEVEGDELFTAVGCNECNGTGYKGRAGVYEVLNMTEAMQEMVLNDASANEIRDLALKEGMISMRRSALTKFRQGLTSIEEVLRVTV